MLTIRKEQMDSFRSGALQAFENDMVIHLAEFSPQLFSTVKEEQMSKVIRFGMSRADVYDFNFKGPVRLYLELMLLFGSHFDTDPQYPWANEILTDAAIPQMERAQQLYQHTCDYLRQVNGNGNDYTLKGIKNIAIFVKQPLTITEDNFTTDVLNQMTLIYPEKTSYIGDEQLKVLISEGVRLSHKYDISMLRGKVLMIILMSAFGHGCHHDPLYTWIHRTLNDELIVNSGARAKRLENKALTWLSHVLDYFNKQDE